MALRDFSRVNDIVSLRSPASRSEPGSLEVQRPSRGGNNSTGAGPETILFLSWGDAKPRYIEKYTNLYADIWPDARIILVETGMADFFWRTEQMSQKLAEPAVKMLAESNKEALLVHVMSNAGAKQWGTLNSALNKQTSTTLSSAVTIIDSAPGRAHFSQTWASLAGSLPRSFIPRMILGGVLGFVLCLMHLQFWLLPGPDVLERSRARLNDNSTPINGARRSYIYSVADKVIGWEDVEDHAGEAERKGWAVKLVKVPGSTHVGHFKQDPVLYRETIEAAWRKDG